MAQRTEHPDGATVRVRWPYVGRPQALLLIAAMATVVTSFFPWLPTPIGDLSNRAGLLTFYAGVIAVPGAIWRSPRVVLAHLVVLAVPAVVLPVQRLLWAFVRLPGFGEAWVPGPGLVLVLISGGVATYAAIMLWREMQR